MPWDAAVKIELVALERLTPDPNNARGHEKGVEEIAASLREFGQVKPAVVWGTDSVVMCGNGLLLAAQSLGWAKLAITRVPADWPYEMAQLYALADNKTAENRANNRRVEIVIGASHLSAL